MDGPSPGSLDGQVVIVTGGARRIGAAIVRGLHEAGARVLIHYRSSAAEARALAAELNARRTGSAAAHAADLADVAALPGIVGAAIATFGGLDVLVNNASNFFPTPIGSIGRDAFDDLIDVNLRAPLLLAQAAAPSLARRRGLVLNIADIHGLRPLKGYSVYSAAKAGLIMLTQSLARELGPQVRVNGIAPGPVLWPERGLNEAARAQIVDRTALKRAGTPEDVARAALFFVRDAPYVTGQVLPVDGGRTLGGL